MGLAADVSSRYRGGAADPCAAEGEIFQQLGTAVDGIHLLALVVGNALAPYLDLVDGALNLVFCLVARAIDHAVAGAAARSQNL